MLIRDTGGKLVDYLLLVENYIVVLANYWEDVNEHATEMITERLNDL